MTLDIEQRRDLHSGDYVRVLGSLPRSRLARLLPYMDLRDEDRLADFACGEGSFASLVCARVGSYEGIDFAPDFVAAAQQRAEAEGLANAHFHCQDISSFCADRLSEFDVVTALDFSEHIYDDEFIEIFGGAHRILRPGGHLYIYTPNLAFFWERMKATGLARQFPQHVAVRDEAWNRRLLIECGFAAEHIRTIRPPHFNIFRHIHPMRRLPFIGSAFAAKLLHVCRKSQIAPPG